MAGFRPRGWIRETPVTSVASTRGDGSPSTRIRAERLPPEASARSQDLAREYEQLSGNLLTAKRDLSSARLEAEEHRARADEAVRARAELAAQLEVAREQAARAAAAGPAAKSAGPALGASRVVAVSAGARQAGACAAVGVDVAVEGPQWGTAPSVGAEAAPMDPLIAAVVADLKERLSAGLEARGKL